MSEVQHDVVGIHQILRERQGNSGRHLVVSNTSFPASFAIEYFLDPEQVNKS
jgi:hypothetical protein